MSDSRSTPLRDAEARAWRYWFSDGLATLVAGLTCLIIAWFLFLDHRRPLNPVSIILVVVTLLAYGGLIFRQRELVEWLKSKITYPRTGYVRPPYFTDDGSQPLDLTVLSLGGADATRTQEWRRVRQDRNRRAVFLLVFAVPAILAMYVIHNPWICTIAGFGLSAAFWFGARNEQRLSWVVLAGLPFFGLYMTIFHIGSTPGPNRAAFFLGGAGLLFLVDGALNLVRYLRKNPRQQGSAS